MRALSIILPLLVIIAMIAWVSISVLKDRVPDSEQKGWIANTSTKKYKYVITKKAKISIIVSSVVSFLCVVILAFVPASIHQINSGEIAVVKVWGEAKEVKTEGLNFDNWISKRYVVYDLKTQEINSKINAYSQDAQSMDAQLTVQFRVQADKVVEINKKFGELDILTERIKSVAEEKTKVVLSGSSAMSLIEERHTLSSKVEQSIKGSMEQYFIDVTMVVVNDITFSEAFENTVEEKMIAEQEKLKAQYEKEKAIIQAEQTLEVAKLEAEAKLAQAKGEADSLETIARAEANSIKLKSIEVARALGFTVLENTTTDADGNTIIEYEIDFTGKSAEEIAVIADYLKYIEYLSKWNGELPDVVTDSSANILIPTPTQEPTT